LSSILAVFPTRGIKYYKNGARGTSSFEGHCDTEKTP